MKKRSIKMRYIVIAAILLLAAAGTAAFLNSKDRPEENNGELLTISRDGAILAEYTLEQIREMPSKSMEAHLSSGKGQDEDGVYTGVPLLYILNQTDEALIQECTRFIAKAGDAFSSVLSQEDVKESENVLVVYEKDGEALKHFDDGGAGPMRIMVIGDTYGNRSTQFLVEIQCQ